MLVTGGFFQVQQDFHGLVDLTPRELGEGKCSWAAFFHAMEPTIAPGALEPAKNSHHGV